MFKKLFVFFNIFIFIMRIGLCYADDLEVEEINVGQIKQEILQTSANVADEPIINSRAAIVIDRESKRILYNKKAFEKRAMASTTKIMTAIVALENSKLDEEIIVSKKSAGIGGSRLGLKAKDKITMLDLIYGLMLRSGNDAAAQIAETIGGNYEGFAVLMNKKAKELGLDNTHFVTPHGLDNPNHYTTAYELALLTDYALNNKKFAEIVNCKTKTILINGRQMDLYNTNELLGNLNGVNGVKTGFTNNAGRCLVTSCTRNDQNLISVVLGADTKKYRTKDSIQILEYSYSNYKKINLKEKIETIFKQWKENNNIKIEKGIKDTIEIIMDNLQFENYLVKEGEEEKIKVEINCEKHLKAPIEQNIKVGEIKVLNGEEIILMIDVLTKEDVNKKNILEYFKTMLGVYKIKT